MALQYGETFSVYSPRSVDLAAKVQRPVVWLGGVNPQGASSAVAGNTFADQRTKQALWREAAAQLPLPMQRKGGRVPPSIGLNENTLGWPPGLAFDTSATLGRTIPTPGGWWHDGVLAGEGYKLENVATMLRYVASRGVAADVLGTGANAAAAAAAVGHYFDRFCAKIIPVGLLYSLDLNLLDETYFQSTYVPSGASIAELRKFDGWIMLNLERWYWYRRAWKTTTTRLGTYLQMYKAVMQEILGRTVSEAEVVASFDAIILKGESSLLQRSLRLVRSLCPAARLYAYDGLAGIEVSDADGDVAGAVINGLVAEEDSGELDAVIRSFDAVGPAFGYVPRIVADGATPGSGQYQYSDGMVRQRRYWQRCAAMRGRGLPIWMSMRLIVGTQASDGAAIDATTGLLLADVMERSDALGVGLWEYVGSDIVNGATIEAQAAEMAVGAGHFNTAAGGWLRTVV